MKRYLLMFFLILSVFGFGSCFWEDEEDDPTSASVTITAQYTGTIKAGVTGTSDGTGKLYVYLLETLDTTAPASCVYSATTDAEVTASTDYTITIDDVPEGDYYVLVFYDYKSHDQREAGKNDRYVLYNNTNCTNNAETITVKGGEDMEVTGITFGDGTSSSNIFGDGAAYKTTCVK